VKPGRFRLPWLALLSLAGAPLGASEQLPILPEDEAAAPQLFIRAFADTAFRVRSEPEGIDQSRSAFVLGELDLFITSQLSPDLSVLSELVYHFGEGRDEEFLEVERLSIKYAPLDAFNLLAGRLHTSIGYWNHSFHHGTWLQTTISRPNIVAFEDDLGILPTHNVGIEATGLKSLGGAVDLQYFASLLNGRGRTLQEIQAVDDADGSKAVNLQLNLVSDQSIGLQAGATAYWDTFPEDLRSLDRVGKMKERIFMGHVVYMAHGVELLAEAAFVRHEELETGRRFDSDGLYAQLAYETRGLKPYFRFDRLDLDDEDPLLDGEHRTLDQVTLGVRWDPVAWLALKGEYRSTELEGIGRVHAALVQAAFTF